MRYDFTAAGIVLAILAGPLTVVFSAGNDDTSPGTGAVAAPENTSSDAESAQTTLEQRKERLRRDLGYLARMEPLMDPQTRQAVPTLRIVIERYDLTPELSTQSDREITRLIRQIGLEMANRAEGGDFDPLAGFAPIRKKVAEAVKVRPEIATGERRVPSVRRKTGGGAASGGGKLGYVTLRIAGREKTIVEVPTAVGRLTPAARARLISQRIQLASRRDPLWYLSAMPGVIKGSHVVLVPKAPDGYIITADAAFARVRQTSPARLAERIAADIRMTVDRPSLFAKARSEEPTPENRAAAAVDLRERGDVAYDRGNVAEADRLYREGLEKNPSYVVLYERIAGIYVEQGERDKAVAIARTALALPGLDAEQRAGFEQILADQR